MNFLAHLYLSTNTKNHRLGNLLPDLSKPNEWSNLPPDVIKGIEQHRLVDRWTDTHPTFKKLKRSVSKSRSKFAGIILDVSFDYLLANNWGRWSKEQLSNFVERADRELRTVPEYAPYQAKQIMLRMAEHSWLSSYTEIKGIERAFIGLSRRVRFSNNLSGAEQELISNEQLWKEGFTQIMEDIIEKTNNHPSWDK